MKRFTAQDAREFAKKAVFSYDQKEYDKIIIWIKQQLTNQYEQPLLYTGSISKGVQKILKEDGFNIEYIHISMNSYSYKISWYVPTAIDYYNK